MKMMIDISEDDYRKVQDGRASVSMMRKAIKNGTPLPKGHGRKALEQDESYDFVKWVATEIFDDYWEFNKDAFAEIACRKLAKLGIVKANGDKWELIEPQESEVQDANSN